MIRYFFHAIFYSMIFVIICLLFAIGWNNINKIEPWTLTQQEIKTINHELNKRNAPDCVLTPTVYGYKCTTSDKRVYRIYMNINY